jgi:ATP-dependent Zn protease
MVLRWGMSEKLGPISFVTPQDEGLPPAFQHQPYSQATSETIDAEVRRIVEECHGEAERLLTEHGSSSKGSLRRCSRRNHSTSRRSGRPPVWAERPLS